jgi:hypothetical protein
MEGNRNLIVIAPKALVLRKIQNSGILYEKP